jgi:hypothetical protein
VDNLREESYGFIMTYHRELAETPGKKEKNKGIVDMPSTECRQNKTLTARSKYQDSLDLAKVRNLRTIYGEFSLTDFFFI